MAPTPTRMCVLALAAGLAALAAGCGGSGEMSVEDVTAEVEATTRERFETGPGLLTRLDVDCSDIGEDLWRCTSRALIETPGADPIDTTVDFRVRCTEDDGCTFLESS